MDAIIMLDLDDVLNPSTMRHAHKSGITGYHKEQFGPVKAWVSAEHGRRLNALPAQIVWATTWVKFPELLAEYAAASGIEAGLPEFDFSDPNRSGSRKLNGVRRWLKDNDAVGLPLVWVDDALSGPDLVWVEERGAPTLTIIPTWHQGLTPALYDDIETFLHAPR